MLRCVLPFTSSRGSTRAKAWATEKCTTTSFLVQLLQRNISTTASVCVGGPAFSAATAWKQHATPASTPNIQSRCNPCAIPSYQPSGGHGLRAIARRRPFGRPKWPQLGPRAPTLGRCCYAGYLASPWSTPSGLHLLGTADTTRICRSGMWPTLGPTRPLSGPLGSLWAPFGALAGATNRPYLRLRGVPCTSVPTPPEPSILDGSWSLKAA